MQQTPEQTQQILIEPERVLPDFTFDQLPAAMREPLEGMGWTTPMPVQAKAIPYLLDNRDMIVQSRTGSGKTGAFLMPLLMRIDPERRHPQALVLIPTRELAMQVHREFEILTQQMNVRGALLYGGVGYNQQLQWLREGAQVIIGTPGRVLDHIGRRTLNLDRLEILVFDEADEMLSMGFYPDMRELRRYLPRQRSSWMFSATMPYKVQMLAREFLHEPEFLSLSAGNVAVTTMEHRYYDVPPLEKDLMLMRLIEFENPESAIIFCNMKVDVEYLSTVLGNYGYNVDQLSGDLDQKSREKAMARIRRGETRFLVATDVAARGIDISDLTHVFQYDVPKDPDSYIHRAGRTARAGNTGVVITLISNISEKSDLKKISRKYNVEFVEMPLPTTEEVEERIGERVTVILEDRYRTGITRIERGRMKRFGRLVQSLAENEEERMLLAMLLDEIYHNTYHQPAPEEPVAEPARSAPARTEPKAPQQQQQRPAQQARPAEGSVGESGGGAPVEGEGGERKKKKKRKKKRNRNRGEQMAGGQMIEGGAADAESAERQPAPGQQPAAGEQPAASRQPAAGQGEQGARRSGEEERGARESAPKGEQRREPREARPAQDRGSKQQGGERANDRERSRDRDRSGDRGGSRRIEVAPEDKKWFDSIEVIEPELFVEPEESARSRSKKEEREAPKRSREAEGDVAADMPAQSSADAPARKRPGGRAEKAAEPSESPMEQPAEASTKGKRAAKKEESPAPASADLPEAAKPKSRVKGGAEKTEPTGTKEPAETPAKPKRGSRSAAAEVAAGPEVAPEPTPAKSTRKKSAAAKEESPATEPARGRAKKGATSDAAEKPAATKGRGKKSAG